MKKLHTYHVYYKIYKEGDPIAEIDAIIELDVMVSVDNYDTLKEKLANNLPKEVKDFDKMIINSLTYLP